MKEPGPTKRCAKHGAVPDKYISCPTCAEEKSYAAWLQFQLHYLPRVIDGELDLTIVTKEGRRHIAFFGFPFQAYCGLSLTHVQKKFKARLSKPPIGTCQDCWRVYDHLLADCRQKPKSPDQAYSHGKTQGIL
jgi:hypothetical protein